MVKGISPTLKTPPGPYPLVVTAEFRRSADNWQIEGPAVCIPLVSSTGHGDAALHRVHYQEGKFALANLLVALIPKDPDVCNAKYLYLLLTAQKDVLLVPLMQGTANVSLKEKDIASVEIPLPPITEQQRIVARVEELAAKIKQAQGLRKEIEPEINSLLAAAYHQIADTAPRKALADVAPLNRRPVTVDVEKHYPQVSVRSFGRGSFHNPPLAGNEITWQKPFLVKSDDILISNIKAWEGALAVALPEDDGRVASHRYLTCVPIPGVATSRFVCFHLLTPEGLHYIGEASPGSADRNRTLSTKALLRIPVPVPPFEQQLWFDGLCRQIDSLKRLQIETSTELAAMLPSILDKAFQGAL
ncbi:MAG: restriction endonuclease subunit S [Geobacteraceae bacterium]|nr:restriction endonuclease subunit S [Geobacteraceae bacterium]